MPPPTFVAVDADTGDSHDEIRCVVCLEPWDDPVALQPCEHILCRACAIVREGRPLDKCPQCRAKVASLKGAHRTLVNIANKVRVRCEACSWLGTREQSRSVHQQCGAKATAPNATTTPFKSTPPPAASSPQPSPPSVERTATATPVATATVSVEMAHDFDSADSWMGLAATLPNERATARIGQITYTQVQCHVRAVELDPSLAHAWLRLAVALGRGEIIMVGAEPLSASDCGRNAVELLPLACRAWKALGDALAHGTTPAGAARSVTVRGQRVTALESYRRVIDLIADQTAIDIATGEEADRVAGDTWHAVGLFVQRQTQAGAGAAEVPSALTCFTRAVEHGCAAGWTELGLCLLECAKDAAVTGRTPTLDVAARSQQPPTPDVLWTTTAEVHRRNLTAMDCFAAALDASDGADCRAWFGLSQWINRTFARTAAAGTTIGEVEAITCLSRALRRTLSSPLPSLTADMAAEVWLSLGRHLLAGPAAATQTTTVEGEGAVNAEECFLRVLRLRPAPNASGAGTAATQRERRMAARTALAFEGLGDALTHRTPRLFFACSTCKRDAAGFQPLPTALVDAAGRDAVHARECYSRAHALNPARQGVLCMKLAVFMWRYEPDTFPCACIHGRLHTVEECLQDSTCSSVADYWLHAAEYALYRRADIKLSVGSYNTTSAAECLRNALRCDAMGAWGWALLGEFLHRLPVDDHEGAFSKVVGAAAAAEAAHGAAASGGWLAHCWLRALEGTGDIPPDAEVAAWVGVARSLRSADTICVRGMPHGPRACLARAYQLAPTSARVLLALAATLGPADPPLGGDMPLSKRDCLLQAVRHDPNNPDAWLALAEDMPADRRQTPIDIPGLPLRVSRLECYRRAAACDPYRYRYGDVMFKFFLAWDADRGAVLPRDALYRNVTWMAPLDCLLQLLQHDPKHGDAWHALADDLGPNDAQVLINGTQVSHVTCYMEALKLQPSHATLWRKLAIAIPRCGSSVPHSGLTAAEVGVTLGPETLTPAVCRALAYVRGSMCAGAEQATVESLPHRFTAHVANMPLLEEPAAAVMLLRCIVAHPDGLSAAGAEDTAVVEYSPEMLCWDDYCSAFPEQRGDLPPMRALAGFPPQPPNPRHGVTSAFKGKPLAFVSRMPFAMHVDRVSSAESTIQLRSITAHPRLSCTPRQDYSPEMVGWDSYRESAGDDAATPLHELFAFPLQCTALPAMTASSAPPPVEARLPVSGPRTSNAPTQRQGKR
jgi:hypothetical protein